MTEKLPEVFKTLVQAGEAEMSQEKILRKERLAADLEQRKLDEDRQRKKAWGFLCVEARIDLGQYLSEYVDWKEPSKWTGKEDTQWLYIRIPGLSLIIAEYRRNKDWYHDRWGVCCHEKTGDRIVNTWTSFNKQEKSVEYILAFAREQYLHKVKLEAENKPKVIHVSDVDVQDLDHQAVS